MPYNVNYDQSVGSVIIPGQSDYHGDLASIQVTVGGGVAGFIYTGGAGSSTNTPVKEALGPSAVNDQFCNGGGVTGEQCVWAVYAVLQVVADGANWVRNVTFGIRDWWLGPCLAHGDSGGPVYAPRADGVSAKGVIDLAIGGFPNPCQVAFTDIDQAVQAFPGSVVVTVP